MWGQRFEAIKDKNPSLYGIRLRSTSQYISERNRTELLAITEVNRFHEVILCFNLVRLFTFQRPNWFIDDPII